MAPPKPRFGGAHKMEPRFTMESKKTIQTPKTEEMEGEDKTQVPFTSNSISDKEGTKVQSPEEQTEMPNVHSCKQKVGQHEITEAEQKVRPETPKRLKCTEAISASEEDGTAVYNTRSYELERDTFQTNEAKEDKAKAPELHGLPEEMYNEGKPVLEHASHSGLGQQKNPDLDKLLEVFETLGISVTLRPYTRRQSLAKDGAEQNEGHNCEAPHYPLSSTCKEENMSLSDRLKSANLSERGKSLSSKGLSSIGDEQECDVIYCKNLFLKDRKGQFYLVVVPENEAIDLKRLKQQLNANRNLSFADEKALKNILKLNPGAVTPLAVMYEEAKDVRIAVHSNLIDLAIYNTKLAFHPLDPLLQVDITYSQLKLFVEHFGKTLEILTGEHDNAGSGDKCFLKEGHQQTKSHTKKTNDNKEQRQGKMGKDKKMSNKLLAKSATNTDTVLDSQEKSGNITVERCSDVHKDDSASALVKATTTCSTEATKQNDTIPKKMELTDFSEINKKTTSKTLYELKHKEENKIDTLDVSFSTDPNKEIKSTEETQKEIHPKGNITANMEAKSNSSSKMHMKWFARKGKLKSYLNKTSEGQAQKLEKESVSDANTPKYHRERTETVNQNCNETKDEDPFEEDNEEEEEEEASSAFSSTSLNQEKVRSHSQQREEMISDKKKLENQPKRETLIDIKQTKVLPEVENFYTSFEKLNISYREVELSCSNSKDIGPSVGCRCFFLKDRRSNYYFIVTHEFYELDFGRLKQALQPKKKLNEVQPEEIMTILGVDPSRMMPFAYPNARDGNIRIFFTNKIRFPQLILSIKHPFASGHRIIMKSSELQRYLRCFGAEIEGVEEKAWAPRYNTIFSQFETGTAENDIKSTADVEQGSDSDSDEANPSSRRNAQQTDSIIGSKVVNWFLEQTPLAWLTKRTHKKSAHFLTHGSSVDLLSGNTHTVTVRESFKKPCNPPAITKGNVKPTTKSEKEIVDKDGGRLKQSQVLENFSSIMNTIENISIDEIERHLQKHCLHFSLKTMDSLKADVQETVTAVETSGQGGGIKKSDDDDSSDEDVDIETCSVIYLKDDLGNSYVVLGGENEYITKRRFCRRFQINRSLTIHHQTFGSNNMNYGMPFSIPILNDAAVTSKQREMIVVLATCLYIDSSTVLRFVLDEAGSTVTMTSEEFEKYARSVGFTVWYMP